MYATLTSILHCAEFFRVVMLCNVPTHPKQHLWLHWQQSLEHLNQLFGSNDTIISIGF
jgi:hypothetical protein